MAKQMCDLKEGKGISRGQSTEHLRNYKVMDPDAKKYGYYDPTRQNLNFEVGRGGVVMPVRKNYAIDQRFKDNLRRRGIVDPNEVKMKKGLAPNRNTIANFMLGGNRERMRELAFGNQQFPIRKEVFTMDADPRPHFGFVVTVHFSCKALAGSDVKRRRRLRQRMWLYSPSRMPIRWLPPTGLRRLLSRRAGFCSSSALRASRSSASVRKRG